MSVSLVKKLRFKEDLGRRGNYIDGINDTHYLYQLLNNEYSPLRAYLNTISPDVKLLLTIDLEVIENG